MNRKAVSRLCVWGATLALVSQCSQQGAGPPVVDAGSGTGGAAQIATGGASGTAGATGAGGGTAAATGGSTGTAGSTGTGGSTGTAGSPGTGGSTGTGGSAGPVLTPAAIVPALDGYLWIGTCAAGAPSTGNATDCPIYPDGVATCPNANSATYATRGAIRDATIPILGTAGTTYTLTMEVRGVAGLRCYNGPGATATRVPPLGTDVEGPTGNDGWQVGGLPADSLWNTWEFHVRNAAGTEVGVYYLNAVQPTSIYCQRHETFVMKYTATFPVLGGGSILARIHDSNCAGQQNCGGFDLQTTCGSPRMVSLVGMDPQPTSSFVQPPITNSYHPQWLFFDVKSVTSP
jgi:hypothetical protein